MTKLTKCSKCKEKVDFPTWENGWPNYGRIELGYAAQIFVPLSGGTGVGLDKHFDAWEKSSKAVLKQSAQSVIFEWGNGYKYDSCKRYRLCKKCQKKLLQKIGKFFRYGK